MPKKSIPFERDSEAYSFKTKSNNPDAIKQRIANIGAVMVIRELWHYLKKVVQSFAINGYVWV